MIYNTIFKKRNNNIISYENNTNKNIQIVSLINKLNTLVRNTLKHTNFQELINCVTCIIYNNNYKKRIDDFTYEISNELITHKCALWKNSSCTKENIEDYWNIVTEFCKTITKKLNDSKLVYTILLNEQDDGFLGLLKI